MANVEITLEVEDLSKEINIDVSKNEEIDVQTEKIMFITTSKHDELQNRDLPDQHQIDSITGLRNELDEIKEKLNTEKTQSYNDLTDKPKINDVELVGNQTSKQIGISAMDEIDIGAILD